ncbi:hypothetical protein QO003_003172 [Arthrobacter silviterrae]|uniref:FG-GAP-like repeat-containing protein n=1 Tax=Arthrobacter silviterrae TaxID=2026658 RepID=UPI00196AC86C|nr:FG-GAP-like repeat-containing protein [Arthrobacter silviterrae]MDQ0278869.1 hypothetical protein [Arthrobacter silviterrae]
MPTTQDVEESLNRTVLQASLAASLLVLSLMASAVGPASAAGPTPATTSGPTASEAASSLTPLPANVASESPPTAPATVAPTPPAPGTGVPPSKIAHRNVAAQLAGHRHSPVCGAPARDHAACAAVLDDNVHSALGTQATTPSGYAPAELQSAYRLPSATAGKGMTVAVIDAFDDPTAAADLAVYRAQYGLPACGTGCFTKVGQDGTTSDLPAVNTAWAQEISLDLDMVSAACPNCSILLVEANSTLLSDLGTAVNAAVNLGANTVSNSYAATDDSSSPTYDRLYYDHPGVAVVAAGGDAGYQTNYPASSPDVVGVGGTSLYQSTNARGWSENAWSGTGSGCSLHEGKPAFQTDTGCAGRTVTDVSAVSDPGTGVAAYDSTPNGASVGWQVFGGTSAASPIIASTYALAGRPAPGTNPVSYPYGHPAQLNDVLAGSNGTCSPSYLCIAGPGYDGPTGLGTPDGTSAFAPSSANSISSVNDVLSVTSAGQLMDSQNTGTGTFATPTVIGTGWTGVKGLFVTDWNNDGVPDLLIQHSNGQLSVSEGIPGGGFSSPLILGKSGWDQLDLTVGHWSTASTYPGIVGVGQHGTLQYWPATSTGALGQGTILATGLTRNSITMLDWNSDGKMDIISRNYRGELYVSYGGNGGTLSGVRKQIGQGWNGFNQIVPAHRLTGSASQGLIGVTPAGAAIYYPINSTGGWASPYSLGTQWAATVLSGGQVLVPLPPIMHNGDHISADTTGALWDAPASGTGSFDRPYQIGIGFYGVENTFITDWNGDGRLDLVVQWNSGRLNVYLGENGGLTGGPLLASSGWGGMVMTVGYWNIHTSHPGIVGYGHLGNLYFWPNPQGQTLGSPTQIGNGWGGLGLTMVDFDGDGHNDILAKSPNGQLRLYRGNGWGGFISETRKTVGTGWNGMRGITPANNFTGPGIGIIAQNTTSGTYYYYPIHTGSFGTKSTVPFN